MVDKFYNCSFDENGYCNPRVDHDGTLPIENDLVTLIKIQNDPFPVYAKSREQKTKLLLAYKEARIPDTRPPFTVMAAWPGKYSQDIFALLGRNMDKYLARLGYVSPEVQEKIAAIEYGIKEYQEAITRNRERMLKDHKRYADDRRTLIEKNKKIITEVVNLQDQLYKLRKDQYSQSKYHWPSDETVHAGDMFDSYGYDPDYDGPGNYYPGQD